MCAFAAFEFNPKTFSMPLDNMVQVYRYKYMATIDFLSETKKITSESLRGLSRILGISVNTIKALINHTPKCRTARKVRIERVRI